MAFGPTGSYSDGQWFLHLYAADVAGNSVTQTYGPYKTDNKIPTLTVSTSNLAVGSNATDSNGEKITGNQGWIFTVNATDPKDANNSAGSGISGYAVTKSTTKPAKSAFASSNKLTAKRSGTYYLWAIDNTGNISNPAAVTLKPDIKFSGIEVSNIKYNNKDIENVIYNGRMLRL